MVAGKGGALFFPCFDWFCSHVRAVVSTLGGKQGAARRADKWQHLYAGFTVWLSQTEATGKPLLDISPPLDLGKQILLVFIALRDAEGHVCFLYMQIE